MSWADRAKAALAVGERVSVRPRGHSMEPRIRSGQLVVLAPADGASLVVGDIVLATVKGRDYLHEISAVDNERVQIANRRGHVNGWVKRSRVHGRMVTT